MDGNTRDQGLQHDLLALNREDNFQLQLGVELGSVEAGPSFRERAFLEVWCYCLVMCGFPIAHHFVLSPRQLGSF